MYVMNVGHNLIMMLHHNSVLNYVEMVLDLCCNVMMAIQWMEMDALWIVG